MHARTGELQTRQPPKCPQCRAELWADAKANRDFISVLSRLELQCGGCDSDVRLSNADALRHASECPNNHLRCPMPSGFYVCPCFLPARARNGVQAHGRPALSARACLSPSANVCTQRATRSRAACTRRAPRVRGAASSEAANPRRRRRRPARVPAGRDRRQALGALPDVPQRGRQQAGMRAHTHSHTPTCMRAH